MKISKKLEKSFVDCVTFPSKVGNCENCKIVKKAYEQCVERICYFKKSNLI